MTSPVYARMSAIEKDGYLGGITLLLAAVALCFERLRRNGGLFWLAVTTTAVVFSAGPTVMIAGRVLGPSPVYNLIFGLPPLSLFPAPNRTSVTVLLGAATLAAFAADAMFAHISTGRRRTILAGAALAGLLSINLWACSPWAIPYPFRIVPFPELYEIIGRDRGIVCSQSPTDAAREFPVLPNDPSQTAPVRISLSHHSEYDAVRRQGAECETVLGDELVREPASGKH
jgi:hypothetical protein